LIGSRASGNQGLEIEMKAKFMALAEAHGIEVEYHPGGISRPSPLQPREPYAAEILLDAPQGKIFQSSGCHCDNSLCHDLETYGTRTNWKDAIAGLAEIIKLGLTDCPDLPDCDICNPDEE
jgi:hypothetical protein